MTNKRSIVALAIIMCMIVALVGCGKTATPVEATGTPAETSEIAAATETESATTQSGEGIKIGISFDSLVSPWWVTNLEVMEKEAAAKGAETVVVMAEGDAAKQNQQIESLLAQGCDVIICGPKDSSAIIASIKKCNEAGVPIIMDNRSVSGDVLPDAQVVASNESMAEQVLEAFANMARDRGMGKIKTILLIGGLADENAVFRKAGHDKAIANNPDVFDVVAEVPTDWNLDTALKGLQNALQANPDVNLIITPSDYLYPPIRSALEQIDRWAPIGEKNHMMIVAFDGDEVGMQYLKDGYSWADAAQDAVLEGKLCIEWAFKLLAGEKPESNIIYDPGQIITVDNWNEVAPTVWSYGMLK